MSNINHLKIFNGFVKQRKCFSIFLWPCFDCNNWRIMVCLSFRHHISQIIIFTDCFYLEFPNWIVLTIQFMVLVQDIVTQSHGSRFGHKFFVGLDSLHSLLQNFISNMCCHSLLKIWFNHLIILQTNFTQSLFTFFTLKSVK